MQNKHLQHPEDSILSGDLTALDWLLSEGDLSVKIDGAPAIVWGTNPATGNFFVGTKSVFNKVKIKINESHADIDANHTGNVADILHACFDNLPDTGCIFQGDFIGFGGGVMYTPNTITYIFDDVITEDIIIAPHTIYVAESDLRDAIASPMVLCPKSTSACKFIKPDAEICPYRDDIEDICKFARQMSTLCTFVNEKQAKELKKVINSYIREGKPVNEHDIAELHDVDINLLRLWKLVYSIKMDLFCFIECDDSIDCYIGGDQVSHEGFVMHNDFGSYKVVDRETFSRLNFTIAKSW